MDIVIKLETTFMADDEGEFVTEYKGEIAPGEFEYEDREDLPEKVGSLLLQVIDVATARLTYGDDAWKQADFISENLGAAFQDVIPRQEFESEPYTASSVYGVPLTWMLLIERIQIENPFRNQGVGKEVIARLLQTFRYCEIAVVKPFGIELEKHHPKDAPELKEAKDRAFIAARARLQKYYERLGFRLITRDHMTYCTALNRQPTLKEAAKWRAWRFASGPVRFIP